MLSEVRCEVLLIRSVRCLTLPRPAGKLGLVRNFGAVSSYQIIVRSENPLAAMGDGEASSGRTRSELFWIHGRVCQQGGEVRLFFKHLIFGCQFLLGGGQVAILLLD